MDYIQYVSQRVKDPATRNRILEELEDFQTRYKNIEWNFMNNFEGWLDPAGPRRRYQMWMADVPITSKTKFSEFTYSEKASEKLKNQTPEEFFKTIDDTVKNMGFSYEELKRELDYGSQNESFKKATESLMKIFIELMAQGYYRYPDLAR
jgi:hypothetical protein